MTYSLKTKNAFLLIPFLIILSAIWISTLSIFQQAPATFYYAMIIDLIVIAPILYFLFVRKRSISNITTLLVFILGVAVASMIIPMEHQYVLALIKKWILPVFELSIITYILFSFYKASRRVKGIHTGRIDFFTLTKNISAEILPRRVVIPFATEIAVFYYGLLQWKKINFNEEAFTYHKTTSTRLVLGVFFFLIIIEGVAIHLLLIDWSPIVAWILSFLSIYGCFQLLGISRSFSKRLIELNRKQLTLRYGIMAETQIPTRIIRDVTLFTKSVDKNDGYAFLSPFKDMEGHNICIELTEEATLEKFYGVKKTFNKILIYLDDPDRFLAQIRQLRGENN